MFLLFSSADWPPDSLLLCFFLFLSQHLGPARALSLYIWVFFPEILFSGA